MRLNKLWFWFWSTFVAGLLGAVVFALSLYQWGWIVSHWSELCLMGLTMAAIAELGFFTYLIFAWLMRGIVRRVKYYHLLLLTLLAAALIVFIFFIINRPDYYDYILLVTYLLLAGLVVAAIKTKQTQPQAFVPTLFFLTVGTAIEAMPAIYARTGEIPIQLSFYTITILIVCNAWQILILHRIVKK